jgi:general stress protein YciG
MPNQQQDNRGQDSGDTSKRGFVSMDDGKQREIASQGGQASGGNFKNDPERASEAGKKGVEESGVNFKNDPERAARADRPMPGGLSLPGPRKRY